jgi:ABC-type lipoprotein export system ATPase subunit
MTPAVLLNGIIKSYSRGLQKVEVLHGLSLEIGTGEFV